MPDYTLEQLADITGMSARTIRFYIQKGLVERPFGARKTPQYTHRHAEQLLQVKRYKEAGLNLSRIADLLSSVEQKQVPASSPVDTANVALVSRLTIADGLTLDIDPTKISLTDEAVQALSRHIQQFLQTQQGGCHE